MLSSLFSLEELVLTDMIVGSIDYEKLFGAILKIVESSKNKLNLSGVNLLYVKAFFNMSFLSILEEIVFSDCVLTKTDYMTG